MVLLPFRTVLPQTENGLVLYLTGNAGAGRVMHDCSPMGNNGRIYGATWVQGKFGKALSFDGVDDYVEVPDSASLDITDELTIEAWIKPESTQGSGGWGIIVSKQQAGSSTDERNYEFVINDGSGVTDGFCFYAKSSTTGNLKYAWSGVPYLDNEWQHAVVTFQGSISKVKFYLNGNLVATKDWGDNTLVPNDYSLKIGSTGTTEHFHGTIDEVRIYNRALSEEEIRAHFKGAVIKLKAGLSAPVRIRGAMILRKPVR